MTVDYAKYKEVKVEKREGVLIITLKQPEEGNPLSWKVIGELKDIWQAVPDDPEVGAVLWGGEGADFSTVRPGAAIHPVVKDHPLKGLEYAGAAVHGGGAYHMSALKCLMEVPQPVIVAVHGLCTGLAATLALHCDIIIAAEDLEIADPHIHRGMVAGDGGAVIWPLLVGPARAKEYLLTGDSLGAAEADRIGLVNRVVPAAELAETAWKMAKRLAEGPQIAIRLTKRAINKTIMHQMELVWELADAYQILTTNTEDFKDAKQAVAEKRPPRFKGR